MFVTTRQTSMSADRVTEIVDALLAEIVSRVADSLKQEATRYFDQTNSPLGPRHHIAAIASGALPGRKLGRRYIATAVDVDSYIRQSGTSSADDDLPDEVEQLAGELGLRNGDKH